MGLFEAAHEWEGGRVAKRPLPQSLSHILYNDTVIPYLKKFQETYKPLDTLIGFC